MKFSFFGRQIGTLVCLFILSCFTALAQSQIQKDQAIRTTRVDRLFSINFDNKVALETLFEETFGATGVPGGIEFSKNEDVYGQVHKLTPKNLLVSDILDSFVSANPRYSWIVDEGVINIQPSERYSILDTRIPLFEVKDIYPSELREKLISTPEFSKYLTDRSLVDKVGEPIMTIKLFGAKNPKDKISLSTKNMSIRQILNEVERKIGRGFWSYREYDLTYENKLFKMYTLVI